MKFETLKRRVSVKNIVIGVLVVTLIVLVIVNRVSHAAYTSTLDVPLVNGKINYKHPDFKMVSMHVQASSGSSTYNETNEMPSGSDYVINSSKSYCNKGNTSEKDTGVVLKTVNGNHVMNNLTKNDRCYLYFDIDTTPKSVAQILAKYTKDDSRNGQLTAPFRGSNPTTVYSKEDDDGTSYVFAGVNPNNWVKIGSMYWRIIRFNGDGTMRLIYSGASSPETSGTGTQISTSVFNSLYNDNAYVGFMYGSKDVSTYAATHANTNSSTIKGVLDTWYTNNLGSYASIIDTNAGFCGDRKISTVSRSNYGTLGYGTNATAYVTVDRYLNASWNWQTSYTPSLKCSSSADLYTREGASKGNKALTNPIGLITADEYSLAGGGSASSSVYYNTTLWLHTGQHYWTMSPSYFSGRYARVFLAYSPGYLNYTSVNGAMIGVRPVINLKASTTFQTGGTGESSNPYVVNIN